MSERYDVAIIGAGFSGSILAWILAHGGRNVALIDEHSHPRFAIGESSTPIADLLLRRLGQRYGLNALVDLAYHGSWQATHADIACGLKRGFSYYVHRSHEWFSDNENHERSLLVAASASDEVADTHWYRAEVDEFFFKQAIAAGVTDFTGYRLEDLGNDSLVVRDQGSITRQIDADWLIDGSGRSAILARLMGAKDLADELQTRTYSTFAHFTDVGAWTDHLDHLGIDTRSDPFSADAAAQHHLLNDGWLWMLRFNNNVTSVGLTSPHQQPTLDWSPYRSLAALFERAQCVAPIGGAISSGRIQKLFDPVIDRRKLMLPTAAVTLDPLHSTGIAHALAGVDRIASIILGHDERQRILQTDQYRQSVLDEARLLDRLIVTAYRTMNDFPRFVAACMLYFAAAIDCEERYASGEEATHLWNADNRKFVSMIHHACDHLVSGLPTEQVVADIRQAIDPWNTAALMDPAVKNRYAYTATKK